MPSPTLSARPVLIILPSVPPTTSPETLATALGPVITPHLTSPHLDLAIQLSAVHTFHSAQRTLANLYLALEAITRNIGGSSCDVAAFFIRLTANGACRTPEELLEIWSTRWKSVLAEKTLAWRDRTWEEYTVVHDLEKTPIEIPLEPAEGDPMVLNRIREGGYGVVAVGGTFDHIHAGHKLLLTMTAYLMNGPAEPNMFIVGITGDPLLKNKKFREFLAAWPKRTDETLAFLHRILPFSRESETEPGESLATRAKPVPPIYKRRVGLVDVEAHELLDPAGPLLTMPEIEALVVSGETREGGAAVNESRSQRGFQKVDVFEVDVLGERSGGKISSTEYRRRQSEKIAEENRNELGYY